MILSVVGTGYVGLITGLCFADAGFRVRGIDKNEVLCSRLNSGVATIHEAGLDSLLRRVLRRDLIAFTSRMEAVSDSDMVFLAVGTPSAASGEADLSALDAVAAEIAPFLRDGVTIVIKSTVPVGTGRGIEAIVADRAPSLDFSVASNPEFLREGTAIHDFTHADRIVCGVRDEASRGKFQELYAHLVARGVKLAFTTPENAELSKYAANAFLAMKVTFINEVADLCEEAGADVEHVASLMGMDTRIGGAFLNAGPGYGGSCFPKDTRAMLAMGDALSADSSLVRATIESNERRKARVAQKVIAALAGAPAGASVAILGVTFKPGTDDVRDAVSLEIIPRLQAAGISVRAHDPKGMPAAAKLVDGVTWHESAMDAVAGADATVLLTDWPDYLSIRPAALAAAMRGRHLFDFRNLFSAAEAQAAGLIYQGVGRGAAAGTPLAVEQRTPRPADDVISIQRLPVRTADNTSIAG